MATSTDRTRIVAEPGEPTVTITREFDAPRELVYAAFTRPEHVARWWGPRAYTVVVDRLDLRPGGEWRFRNVGADGQEHAFRGVFEEIVPPERIVWTFEYEGAPGHVSVETITFAERDGRTVAVAHCRYASVEARDAQIGAGMEGGLRESYHRLDELLADLTALAAREVVQRRVFDAPRERVWELCTERRHVDRWWGPRGFTTTTHEMAVRPGGVWRFDMALENGPTFTNRVDYLEVVRPERLVYRHGDGDGANAFHVTMTFADRDGKTELTMRSLFPTAAARDYVVREYNAIELGRQTLDKLAEALAGV